MHLKTVLLSLAILKPEEKRVQGQDLGNQLSLFILRLFPSFLQASLLVTIHTQSSAAGTRHSAVTIAVAKFALLSL